MDIKHEYVRKPVHILAKPEDVAEKVVAAGDPDRVSILAKLLEKPRLVNEHRGFLAYTGYFEGEKITVVTHGIGAPSAAIVFEELLMLGARTIVRLGSCGSFHRDLKVGDVVVPEGAAYIEGGTIGMYLGKICYPAVPDFELTELIVSKLLEENISVKKGLVFSSDAFHAEEDYIAKCMRQKMIAVEMECATLFILSRLKGFKSASALIVVNDLLRGTIIDVGAKRELEKSAGKAVLHALAEYS